MLLFTLVIVEALLWAVCLHFPGKRGLPWETYGRPRPYERVSGTQ